MLDDGSAAVRCAAVRHPALPARSLVRALRDDDLRQQAVLNPALPESVMHWMIDTALTEQAATATRIDGDTACRSPTG
ncbi:hypothetical protein ABT034_30720 [Streptomyces sp. NPDC002773]|uniref:hypothetical protein n=1 Tax=Streptomyces sp. NPDC002773 TaxID=3154430 RepID=UPI00333014D5